MRFEGLLESLGQGPQAVAEQVARGRVDVLDPPFGRDEPLLAPPRGVAGRVLPLCYICNQFFGEGIQILTPDS